ncbi:MAG: carboxypeptidase-like regulatory domain-containing protein [Pyrinomonadaceae bacterium]
MKILQILVLIVLVCGFSSSVKAQADCRYGLKFFVQDEAGKVIENAKLELVGLDSKSNLPSYVKLLRMDDAYIFTSNAGQTVNGDFQVNISADGFRIHQQKVNFPICKVQNFDVKLKPLTNEQINSTLSGTVYDANGSVIVKAKVTAINQKGEKFEVLTNEEGIYSLNLLFNQYNSSFDFTEARYDIIVEMMGFKKSVTKDFVFIPSQFGKMQLDIGLEIQKIIDTIIIPSKKLEKKSKN